VTDFGVGRCLAMLSSVWVGGGAPRGECRTCRRRGRRRHVRHRRSMCYRSQLRSTFARIAASFFDTGVWFA
jgi:hypothetical protein